MESCGAGAHIGMLSSGRAAGRGLCLLPGMGARDGELLVTKLDLCPICQGVRGRVSGIHTYIHEGPSGPEDFQCGEVYLRSEGVRT